MAWDGAQRRPSEHIPWWDRHWPGPFCTITHPHCTQPLRGKNQFYRGADSDSKESACSAGDPGSIPGWGRSPGEENGNPLQYSCLENPMDRGAWWATVSGVSKSQTRLRLMNRPSDPQHCLSKITQMTSPEPGCCLIQPLWWPIGREPTCQLRGQELHLWSEKILLPRGS